MLPTLLSLAALALARSPYLNFQLVHSGDATVHQKLVYVDDDGFLNANGNGKLFTGLIENQGELTGYEPTPGFVAINSSSPALRLSPAGVFNGPEFSLVNGELILQRGDQHESEFLVCEGLGGQIWVNYLGGDCPNPHPVAIIGLDKDSKNPDDLFSTSIGSHPTFTPTASW